MRVTPDEYMDKLVEYCIMKLYAVATVTETRQTWADEDDFQILKPNIDIRVRMYMILCFTHMIYNFSEYYFY